MTRFGVMKHLAVLEEAGLLTTRRAGREKLHYLNPMPIQLVYDRWVSKFARPWAQNLAHLKHALEELAMPEVPSHVYQIFIAAPVERVWQALTDGDLTAQYYFGSRIESTFAPGAPYRYASADGSSMIEGEIVACEPPSKLVTTFRPLFSGDADAPVTTVRYELEPREGGGTKLTLVHEGLEPGAGLSEGIKEGWAMILSDLKTLLERGAA
jgi:uncharacterized protein YndB with AHSA1/START domain